MIPNFAEYELNIDGETDDSKAQKTPSRATFNINMGARESK